jgi:transcriptional regulator with XRE-family HTH domain
MGRREKPVGAGSEKAVKALALWLREQRQRAGLTYQQMADRTEYTRQTLSRAASGHSLPSQRVAEAYARVCGADPLHARRLWLRARQATVRTKLGDTTGIRPEYVQNFADLHTAMRELWLKAGAPPLRELERRAGDHGQLPHSSLSLILRQRALPQRRHLKAFVTACGVPDRAVGAWEAAWERANRSSRHSRDESYSRYAISSLEFHTSLASLRSEFSITRGKENVNRKLRELYREILRDTDRSRESANRELRELYREILRDTDKRSVHQRLGRYL